MRLPDFQDRYETNVKAIIAFLRVINVKVNDHIVDETLHSHPEWPSLLCISDALSAWHVPNGAGRIDPKEIDDLPTPFIAKTYDRADPLYIVTAVSESTISGLHKDYTKVKSESKENFLKNWDGIYLLAEPNQQSGEPAFVSNKRKAFLSALLPLAVISIFIVFSLLWITKSIANSGLVSSTGIYIEYFTLLTGVFISTMLLWYEIDKSNPLLQKVCTGIAKGNCNAILSGKQAKVFSWLSWSEVGFFYFSGRLLAILFSGNLSNVVTLLTWLSLLALPYTIFSIYYQWRVARQWCVLCLGIQALLVIGAWNTLTHFNLTPMSLPPTFLFNTLAAFLLPVCIWYTTKPYFLQLQQAKTTKREYSRLKYNTEIFDTLLKKQKEITHFPTNLGIDIGNPHATNKLIKVCNPYCGPCARAHPLIEDLIQQSENIKAKIIFTAANDESNPGIKPVRHLLAIAAKGDPTQTQHALDDWYLPTHQDYDAFASKYRMNGELLQQGDKIQHMDAWCKANEIHFTPTIFVNGHQLPEAYSIEDLKYFLLE
jgi:protein-disulfide isomerase/uncharacterized membrane protein